MAFDLNEVAEEIVERNRIIVRFSNQTKELEQKVATKDERIAEMEKQVAELEQKVADLERAAEEAKPKDVQVVGQDDGKAEGDGGGAADAAQKATLHEVKVEVNGAGTAALTEEVQRRARRESSVR